ncbi:MAG: AraC family ligand binding domain-containing protein [Clostridia bacterium]|nr:AraC family ligand binding domain-containing protein [Clostridia bacterium]
MDSKKTILYGKTIENLSREVLPGHTISERISKNSNEDFSVVVSTMDGKHPRMKNTRSVGIYCIKKGEGTFYADDRVIHVGQNDVISIPPNTVYSFEGDFEAFMICVPPFDAADCIIFEDEEQELE